MGTEGPQGLVLRPLALELALLVGEQAGAADNAAAHAAVGHGTFAAAFLGQAVHGLAGHAFVLVELAHGEVGGGQTAGFVQDVHQHAGAVFGQALAGDGMLGQSLGEALGSFAEGLFIRQRMVLAALGVDDDGLEALGAHDGTHAAAAGMTHGTQLAVGESDTGGGQLELTGAADGHIAALVAVGLHQFGDGVEVVEAGHGGGHQLGGVLAQFQLPPFAFGGHVFNDDGHDAQLGQMAAGLATGVGFLDAFGEGALAAHGNTVAVGAVGGAQQAGGEHQLVVGAQRRTDGVDFARHDGGGQGTTAQTGVFFGDIFKHTGLGGHVDPQETEHETLL